MGRVFRRFYNLAVALAKNGPTPLWRDFLRLCKQLRLKLKGHRRVLPVRDICFPFHQFPLDFTNEFLGIKHKELAGLYRLDGLILHTPTGQLLHQPNKRLQSTIIREATVEDVDRCLQEDSRYRELGGKDEIAAASIVFDKDVHIFEIFKRKKNYYHFLVDNSLRLITFLEQYQGDCIILHNPGLPLFAQQFLDIVSDIYGVEVKEYPAEEFVKISNSTIVMDHVLKRYFHDFDTAREENYSRLKFEKASYFSDLGRNRIRPVYSHYPMPVAWETDDGDLYSNDTLMLLPSRTEGEMLQRFVRRFIDFYNVDVTKRRRVFIDRSGETKRGKHVSNMGDVIAEMPEIEPVKFGGLSMKEQIVTGIQCDILIGVNGSGLTNSLFMAEGTTLVNLVPENIFVPKSNIAGAHCGIHGVKYQELIAYLLSKDDITLRVDVKELTQLLKNIGASNSSNK